MTYLKNINSPSDVKRLDINELNTLCGEIREFLVKSVSKTGGHLGSNLGIVELTVALHYCFNSPTDKIIWDVGHQSYVHKILTGRLNMFNTLRKFKGLSGFPKPEESEHDAFCAGHSSTSVSVGLGFCAARDLDKANYSVISVIGDGAMSGGLVFEALNNAGERQSPFIIILNDNQMSISRNVGGIAKMLNAIRTAPAYLVAKADISRFIKKIPVVGGGITNALERVKDTVRYLLVPGAMFEELGIKYVGPVDGHNIEELINVLERVKKMEAPVLLHVYTKKGKGYKNAERAPHIFHGVEPFNIETGKAVTAKKGKSYTDAFGKAIVKLAEQNQKIVAITAAMQSGTGLNEFKKRFPERIFDVGIAEAHGAAFAAALAKNGYKPVFAVYSTFLQRCYDQIIHDVCLQNLPVVFAVDRAGIVGADGATHQGVFDLSFLSHISNLTVMAPRNGIELEKMLAYAFNLNSPVAIRYPRGTCSTLLSENVPAIEYGKGEVLENGHDIAIISVGVMFDTAYAVHKRLKEEGFSPMLYNARFISPVDKLLVGDLSRFDFVFVLEDNIRDGGFGSKLLMDMADGGIKCTCFHSFAFPEGFIEHGTRDEIFKMYGIDAESVYNKIRELLKSHGA